MLHVSLSLSLSLLPYRDIDSKLNILMKRARMRRKERDREEERLAFTSIDTSEFILFFGMKIVSIFCILFLFSILIRFLDDELEIGIVKDCESFFHITDSMSNDSCSY